MLHLQQYKLPEGICGERVLLQWQWITFLGCKPPGSELYEFPEFWNTNYGFGNMCEVDSQGRLPSGGNDPQHYWQCSEVTIQCNGSNPTSPVAPPTDAPVTPVATPTNPPISPPTDAPVAAPTDAPVDSSPCGECVQAPGKNQPECFGQSQTKCVQFITNEGKCEWIGNSCEGGPSPSPPVPTCGTCTSAPGQNQPECNQNTEERCFQMMANENKCSWEAC